MIWAPTAYIGNIGTAHTIYTVLLYFYTVSQEPNMKMDMNMKMKIKNGYFLRYRFEALWGLWVL